MLTLLAWVGAAAAHDFWITPSAYRCTVGEDVDLTLLVGHAGNAERYGRRSDHLKRFWIVDPAGKSSNIPGVAPVPDGPTDAGTTAPAGRATLRTPGVHIIAYRSNHSAIELDAKTFEGYLRDEGLTSIIAERARRGESERPDRELYSRASKTLVLAGDEDHATPRTGFDRLIGLPVEITPHTDPFDLSPGDTLVVSVHHRGTPAIGVQIDAEQWSSAEDRIHLRATTDDEGRAEFDVSRSGTWLITTTQMERATAHADYDWESVWGSLTVEVRK